MGKKEAKRKRDGNRAQDVDSSVFQCLVKLGVTENVGKVAEANVLLNRFICCFFFRFPGNVQPIRGTRSYRAPALPSLRCGILAVVGNVIRVLKGQIDAQAERHRPKQEQEAEERADEELGRKSWVVWVRNQAELKAYVQDVIQLVGGPPGDPEPFRRFHISIANLTGNPGDSVQ